MHWWQICLIVWAVGVPLTAFWIGYRRQTTVSSSDYMAIIGGCLIWPLMTLLGAPHFGGELRAWRDSRETRRIRLEAEKQVVREERRRSSIYNKSSRKLDL